MRQTERAQASLDDTRSPPLLIGAENLEQGRKHGNGTAKRAATILVQLNEGFVIPTATQKKRIVVAFAKADRVVYGKAYDIVKIRSGVQIDLDDQGSIESHLESITLYEIKSTRRENVDASLKGYFFALTTAELLVAQSLRTQFRFVFVNVRTRDYQELTLREVLARARGFYPQWSICF